MRIEALKAAVAEAKKGRNIARYGEAVAALSRFSPNELEAQQDQQWISNIERQNKVEGMRLEAELKGYKNNLVKESIRVGAAFQTLSGQTLNLSSDGK